MKTSLTCLGAGLSLPLAIQNDNKYSEKQIEIEEILKRAVENLRRVSLEDARTSVVKSHDSLRTECRRIFVVLPKHINSLLSCFPIMDKKTPRYYKLSRSVSLPVVEREDSVVRLY